MITTQIHGHGTVGLIKVEGRLTFQEYYDFKACAKKLLEENLIKEIDVDLSGTTYMDSNALSMLIALKGKTGAKNITLKLIKPSPLIQTLLEMVQFEKLFQIVQ